MKKALLGITLVAVMCGPMAVLLGVAVVVNPAPRSSCTPTGDLTVGSVPGSLTATTVDGTRVDLDRTQLEHAATIIATAADLGVPRAGVRVALMAGLTESWLRMLSNTAAYPESGEFANDGDGGDHDSLGIFQMRPSTGWGTVSDLMEARYQARAFFGGPEGPNDGSPRGLLDIPGWQQMDPGAAAQAVEVSAYPDRYTNNRPIADAIMDRLLSSPPEGRDATTRDAAGQSGTGRVLGALPHLSAVAGGAVTGRVRIVNANLRNPATTPRALRTIRSVASPDFVTLNEIHSFSPAELERALPGYGAYKDPVPVGVGNRNQSLNNAIMWRRDTWRLTDGGRVQIVSRDHAIHAGHRVLWDRYATWGVFERRTDGATLAVISTHHMTNVRRFPRQWGNPPLSRRQQYDQGMDVLVSLAEMLGRYGPVLLGGDMNSHAGDGPFAAVPRMRAAGFDHTKDRGVMYQFFPRALTVLGHREIAVPSDHPANSTTLAMNGVGPNKADPGLGGDCVPCPGFVALPGLEDASAAPVGGYNLGPVSTTLRQLVAVLAPMFGISSVGGYRPDAIDPLGHPSGNAADFMIEADSRGWATPEGRRTGDALAAYAQANATDFGVDYIIWWQRIWSLDRADEGWRPMNSRGSATADHRDHVHINVVPGAPVAAVTSTGCA